MMKAVRKSVCATSAKKLGLCLIKSKDGKFCLYKELFAWRHNAVSLSRLIKQNPNDYEVNQRRKKSVEAYLWAAKKALRIAKVRGYIKRSAK